MEKVCTKCGISKDAEKDFHRDSRLKSGRKYTCKACEKVKDRLWRQKNKEKLAAKHRKYAQENREHINLLRFKRHERFRLQALEGYGGKCQCCGESITRFLTIDHVNNDGFEERRTVRSLGTYKRIIKQGFPPEYQVLCMNCNAGRYWNGGICPHKIMNA